MTALGKGEAGVTDPVRVCAGQGHVGLVLQFRLAKPCGRTHGFPDRAGAGPLELRFGEERGLGDHGGGQVGEDMVPDFCGED